MYVLFNLHLIISHSVTVSSDEVRAQYFKLDPGVTLSFPDMRLTENSLTSHKPNMKLNYRTICCMYINIQTHTFCGTRGA
jgi:hypothetical protein